MHFFRSAVKAIFLFTLFLSSNQIFAFQFTNLFFFGDSLSDVGNLPEAPRTTNRGPLWANWVGQQYGQNILPSKNGGTDFALYGSQSPTLSGRISLMLERGVPDPKAAYFIWSGANDYLFRVIGFCEIGNNCKTGGEFDPAKINAQVNTVQDEAVSDILNAVNQLHNAGAKYLIVNNLPELGLTPSGRALASNPATTDLAENLAGMIGRFNGQLSREISALPYDVIQVDIYGYLNYVINNPARFGFANVSDAWCTNINPLQTHCMGNVPADPATYLFFDGVHPSEAAHQDIADFIYYGYLVGPTYEGLLAQVPFNVMNVHTAVIGTQLMPLTYFMEKAPEKSWRSFASGSFMQSKPDAIDTNTAPSYKNNSYSGTIGAIYQYTNEVLFGAAITPSHNQITAGNLYQFDMNELLGSLFGQFEIGRGYANGILSFGIPTYNDIVRNVPIGITNFQSTPNTTTGRHFGAQANAGFQVFTHKQFTTGPYVGLDYQHINVNGYDEAFEMSAIALNFFDQTNEVLTSTLGWQATAQLPIQTKETFAQLFGGYKTQHMGQDRDIRFETANFAGSHGAVPTSGPQGSYGNAGMAITTFLTKKLSLTLSAQTNFGNDDFNQQIYNLTASLIF